jgi:DNA-binding response OmpR family regulator
MRILIADDEHEIAHALAEFVESCGHQVSVVTTGGLDVLNTYDRFKPDIVIMDIMMPRFNGITVSNALVGKNRAVKIVLISGKLDADHPFVKGSGAIRFLPKPVRLEAIKRTLDELGCSASASA